MIRTLFLSMQELNKGARRPKDVPATKVKKIGVIGAGFMGASVGYVSARAGLDVVLIDRDQESADKGKAHAQKRDRRTRSRRAAPRPRSRDALLARITPTADYARSEGRATSSSRRCSRTARSRRRPLPRRRQYLKPDVIFASNTSTLPITSLAEGFKDQGKFVGIHFFSPVEKMMLVEIIKGKNTGDVALATALDYVRADRQDADRRQRQPRLLRQSLRRPLHRRRQRDAPRRRAAGDDRELRQDGRHAGRPALAVDEVALDLGLKIMKATEADLGPNAVNPRSEEADGRDGREAGPPRPQEQQGLLRLSREGQGQKSLWPGLAALQPKQLDPDTLDIEELKQRFLVVQAVEAARTVEDHVITDPREADVGSILGFGFAPFTGGTLSYIDFMGTKKFVELCHKLEAKYGSRFTPPKLLEEMAAKGETFYGRFAPKKAAAA